MPEWVADMPEESRRVFEACFGKTFRVESVDENQLCVLDVSQRIDPSFRGFKNNIRLEPEFLEKVISTTS